MGIPPEFAAFLTAPVPAVNPEDMRRLWPLLEGLERGHGATGFDINLLKEHCSANANVVAVMVRVALVKSLLQQGVLDAWREGDGVRPRVFEVVATCSLLPEEERMEFDAQAILSALESAG
jgi:hypothetical protein